MRWAPDSTTVQLAPGPHYGRGAAWRFFFGDHYRDIWTTPVTAPVIRLAKTELDSLIPLRAGGSYQSHTLRLRTKSGYQRVLRSVDKDMSAAIPAGWKRNLLAGLVKDQTSATLPYGAYIAARLADAAGVYHANPRLVYLPDDPALGKFRRGYANALYLLEERAEGDQQAQPNFGNSRAILNSRSMLTALRLRPSARVEARAYLRARLLDMWVGDWSRREDQWRWASFATPGRTTYRPIPRDRDQAFFLLDDGVVSKVFSWVAPKFQSFHANISARGVNGLTTTARALDRTLLSSLSADDFRQEADSLLRRLSDKAIDYALEAGPPETRATIAAKLKPLLLARRAQLPVVAQRYFALLANEAWVVGTDRAERFRLAKAGAGQLRVQMLAVRPHRPDSLMFERIYRRTETQKIFLYGLGGNDVFDLAPDASVGVEVVLCGGAGQNWAQVARRPGTKEAPVALAGFTWLGGPSPHPAVPGLNVEDDPQPELSRDARAWLGRYNLRD